MDEGQSSLRIVGIGASAGGVPALQELLYSMPDRPGLAFVVVMHLSPEHESRLAEVLQYRCPITVTQVEASTVIEPDHVYVVPPGKHIDSVDTRVQISEKSEGAGHGSPIDHFFRTLADSNGSRAVGVILSGEGDDGTVGIRRIRESGGLTIAQSPVEAEHDAMPRAAIESGRVDVTLRAAEIVNYILGAARVGDTLSKSDNLQLPESEDTAEDQSQSLQKIFAQLRTRTGHDFNHYKRPTVLRRIARRMQINQLTDLGDYLDLVRDSPEEQSQLFEDLLITVTEFFRDTEVFEEISRSVIPRLFEGKTREDTVRVWSVGCSTGEEAFSLAMLLAEQADREDNPPAFQVFASDVHEPSLRIARQAVYPKAIEADVSPERLRRFFVRDNGGYKVREDLRGSVTFAPHNFLKNPPFSRLDLVVCRNVLIYLRREVQRDVLRLFHYALKPDGLLVLGTSESVEDAELFARENRKARLYKRRNVPSGEQRLPVFPLSQHGETSDRQPPPPRHNDRGGGESYGRLHEKIVEQYGPPSVLVNPNHQVVHYSASAGRFFQMPGGQPTQELFRIARPELRAELRTTILAAVDRRRTARSSPIDLEIDGEPHRVVIRAFPPAAPELAGFLLVMFDELELPREAEENHAEAEGESAEVHERWADRDLNRERPQSANEEYETSQEEIRASNEELQSTNEELRSALEELEISKEELQAMNEELATANSQNRQRV
ncbi:MAG: CheR family methyltransferase, partial [Phycisphaeraceae bacterium]